MPPVREMGLSMSAHNNLHQLGQKAGGIVTVPSNHISTDQEWIKCSVKYNTGYCSEDLELHPGQATLRYRDTDGHE